MRQKPSGNITNQPKISCIFDFQKGTSFVQMHNSKKNLTSSLFFRPFYWGHLFKVFRSFLGLTFPDEESIIKSLMCLRLRVPAWPRNPANQLIRRLSTVVYHGFFSTIQKKPVVGNGNGISEACNSTSELELLYGPGVDIDVILRMCMGFRLVYMNRVNACALDVESISC